MKEEDFLNKARAIREHLSSQANLHRPHTQDEGYLAWRSKGRADGLDYAAAALDDMIKDIEDKVDEPCR